MAVAHSHSAAAKPSLVDSEADSVVRRLSHVSDTLSPNVALDSYQVHLLDTGSSSAADGDAEKIPSEWLNAYMRIARK